MLSMTWYASFILCLRRSEELSKDIVEYRGERLDTSSLPAHDLSSLLDLLVGVHLKSEGGGGGGGGSKQN